MMKPEPFEPTNQFMGKKIRPKFLRILTVLLSQSKIEKIILLRNNFFFIRIIILIAYFSKLYTVHLLSLK